MLASLITQFGGLNESIVKRCVGTQQALCVCLCACVPECATGRMEWCLSMRMGWPLCGLRYVKQVLDAVAYLHQNGIVHGNISIDHLLVTSTESTLGCIKLAGFLSAWRIRKDSNRSMACVPGCGVRDV